MEEPLWRAPIARRTLLVAGGTGLLLASLRQSAPIRTMLAAAATPSLQLDLLRREDMLKLHYDFYNLKLTDGVLTRLDTSLESLIVVEFDSQHVMEQTTFKSTQQGNPPPVESLPKIGELETRAVDASRIAFLLPPTVKSLPFTEEGLLSWPDWVMRVVPVLGDGKPKPPDALQTDLRLVDWLSLTPEQIASWAHTKKPVTQGDRTELWHTRLAVRDVQGRPDPLSGTPTVRAIDFEKPPADTKFKALFGYSSKAETPRMLVEQSNQDDPVKAELLLLSAQGSSLELFGEWGGDRNLVIAQWRHRSTIGRDNYVRIEERGFLFPYGHRCVLVTETERQIVQDGAAHLIQRSYIRVQQDVKDYEDNGFPFVSVRIAMSTTPNLAEKAERIPKENENAPAFWVQYLPEGAGKPTDVPFPMIGTDWSGNKVEFTAFLAFVPINEPPNGVSLGLLRTMFAGDKYNALTRYHSHALGGQKVAFAPPSGSNPGVAAAAARQAALDGPLDGDTSLPAAAIHLSSADGDPAGPWRWLPEPSFMPRMLAAEVRLPSVENLVGKEVKAAIGYDPKYLEGSFEAVKGEAYARVQQTVHDVGELIQQVAGGVEPDTLKKEVTAEFKKVVSAVGGVATPDLNIGALSRQFGPLSGPAKEISKIVAEGKFDPKKFFPDTAKLLGGIKISDLIGTNVEDPTKPLNIPIENGPKIVVTQIYPGGDRTKPPQAIQTTLDWVPKMPTGLVAGVFWPKADGKDAKLTLHGETRTELGDGATTYNIKGDLRDFEIELVNAQTAGLKFIKLTFRRFSFEARDNAKPNISVDLARVQFQGPLNFVNTLQRYLSSLGKGITVDVQPTGISAGYTLAIPNVGIGVFALQHLAFSASLHLPFDGSAARARFAFCSREHPFTLTVSGFGGGGFLALALGTDGLELLEASIEFGGAVALNLGVASGSVSVMAGIYFKLELTGETERVQLTGFLRANGQLSVLGLITISAEFYLALSYTADETKNVVEGEARLTVSINLMFFSKSVTLRVHKSFAGPQNNNALAAEPAPPKFGDLMSQQDWNTYCDAFAA